MRYVHRNSIDIANLRNWYGGRLLIGMFQWIHYLHWTLLWIYIFNVDPFVAFYIATANQNFNKISANGEYFDLDSELFYF